ncbi:MAG: glycoside hydrolase family 2 protein [Bacteroidota bacterium]|nr:glycoside hydrolase family 2 protein [Bacteroidota bacterium]
MTRISGLWYIFLSGLLVLSCQHAEQEINTDFELKSAWEFHIAGDNQWLPASVPGDVASDLYRNHKIQIPSINNISKIRWVDKIDWEYRTMFDVPQATLNHSFINLTFGCLNPIADVFLNDSLILKSNNMFRVWNVECKRLLKPTGNRLRIYFHALRNAENTDFVRRTIYQTSLAEALRFQNAGIGRSVHIQAWSGAKINEVHYRPVAVSSQNARYSTEISVLSANTSEVSIELLINNKVICQIAKWNLQKGTNSRMVEFDIKKPKLWYTNGLGKPYLYDFVVRLKKGNHLLHETLQHLGVRTIDVVYTKKTGNGFYFKVNGSPLFIKGTEYIAGNSFNLVVNPVTRKRLVEAARTAHLNLIRITNDGIYEDEDFYNYCDENGILVWQDFMLDESKPATDSIWWNNIIGETTDIIKQYRNHACLALWCGDLSHVNPDNKQLFQDTLPSLVKKLSEQTDYQITSYQKNGQPSSNPLITPLVDDNMFASYPSLRTINRFGTPVNRDFGGAAKKNTSLYNYMLNNYNTPKSTESLIYLSQLAQAEVMKNIIEKHRRDMPVCMGSIFRLLNDYAPAISYSVIDSNHWKPAMFAIKNAYSHILVMPVREKNKITIYSSSEALKDQDAILLAKLIDFSGKDLYAKQVPVLLKANSCKPLLSIKEQDILKDADPKQCCLVIQLNQPNITLSQNILYFTQPKNLALTKPQISININTSIKGYNLILRTDRLAKNVWLETTSGQAWFSDNNFDLLPGKRTKIPIRYNGTKDALYKDLKIKTLADTK